MYKYARFTLLLFMLPLGALAHAQKTSPDTLVFVNGEKLTGDLEKADGTGITFKSPMAGEITVKWDVVKQLSTSKKFAVLAKNVKLTRKDMTGTLAQVPQGDVAYADKQISVGQKTVPVADASLLIPGPEFDGALHARESFMHGWGGAASAGLAIAHGTQSTATFGGALNLTRSFPTVGWLPPRDRTILNLSETYGKTTQTDTPTIETNIMHAQLEQDEFVSPRVFVFGTATFDNNLSQALQLSSAIGGGVGVSVIKDAKQELDVKADAHFLHETFFVTDSDLPVNPPVSVFASSFSETYMRHLHKGIEFNEFGSISPAWTKMSAFSSHINGSLVFPVYKGFGFNVTAADDYLNNAPAGTNQNSTQFTMGLTFAIKPR